MRDTVHTVQHLPQEHRFVIQVEELQAELQYRLESESAGAGAVDFTYTFVPPQLRGQGLAERLVRQGLKWARGEGLQIRASCWYVARFLR